MALGRRAFPAFGTTAVLLTTGEPAAGTAESLLRAELDAIDRAASRFRTDSEISWLHRQPGRAVRISPLLYDLIAVALRAARRSGGLVDPTVGPAVRALGYDRDFREVRDADGPAAITGPAPGWHRIRLDPAAGEVLLPRGITLDLGATAKAYAADRAATRIAAETGTGVLVSLGGDLRVAGPAPAGGWQIAIGDDHRSAADHPIGTVSVHSGGLATSSTTQRSWRRNGRTVHHIVDPRTGDAAAVHWRTVSVAAESCVDANTASTAAIVLGRDAARWLADHRLPALLVGAADEVQTVAGWPEPQGAAA
ncbi:MAG TPA: FAD:protein FMN transferase [Mycobacteriales bacterium]|nr:FAD:protein FMN transferase [Mycobacteriales bacterium]